jgi:hypothetical protein
MLNVIMLNFIMLNVIMLNVIMQSVVAPFCEYHSKNAGILKMSYDLLTNHFKMPPKILMFKSILIMLT